MRTAAADGLWQASGVVPASLVGALQSRRDVVAACGLAPRVLGATLHWAWRTESTPPRASFLADLYAYSLTFLAHFRYHSGLRFPIN